MTNADDNVLLVNPKWQPFVLNIEDVRGLDTGSFYCFFLSLVFFGAADWSSKFEIIVYDYDKDGTHDMIGRCYTTLREWYCIVTVVINSAWPVFSGLS